MTELLGRRIIKPQHDLRRLVLMALAVTVISVVWHQVRPPLVQALARSSLGCDTRSWLIGAALEARYPQVRGTDKMWSGALWSWRTGNLAGACVQITQPRPTVGSPVAYGVADETLTLRGTLIADEVARSPQPGDWDHDGRTELVVKFYPHPNANVGSFGVVRLNADYNEIVAVILVDYSPWVRSPVYHRLEWRDAYGADRSELAVVRYKRILPRTTGATSSSELVAAFVWDAPGGILRPRLLPEDGSVLVWTPEDGRPLVVAADEPLDPLLARLVPLPPGFGQQIPATTSAPSVLAAPATAAPDSPTP